MSLNENNLTNDEKTLMTFCLMLSDKAFQAWTGEIPTTVELYREIFQTASKFKSPYLIIRLYEKYGLQSIPWPCLGEL